MSTITSKEINEIKLKLNEPIISLPKRQKKSKNESTSSSSESKPQRSNSTNKRESALISELQNSFGLSSSLIRKKKQHKDYNINNNKQQIQLQTQTLTLQQQQLQQKHFTISDLKKQFLNMLNTKPAHIKKTSYRIKGIKYKQSHPPNHNSNSNHINTHSQSNIMSNTNAHHHHNNNYNSNNHPTLSTDYTLSTLPQVSIDLNSTKDLSINEVKEMTYKLKQLNGKQLQEIKPSYIKELKNLHKVIEAKIATSKSNNVINS